LDVVLLFKNVFIEETAVVLILEYPDSILVVRRVIHSTATPKSKKSEVTTKPKATKEDCSKWFIGRKA
jgi:hypothetical protein